VQSDEQPLREPGFFAVNVQEVVVASTVAKRLLKSTTGYTLMVLSIADIKCDTVSRKRRSGA
jgi:hypothetical protein